jgi:type I restriction enzyme M protein
LIINLLQKIHGQKKYGFTIFRTNQHFTLKTQQLKYEHLKDFITCYNPKNRFKRKETEQFKKFTYDEITSRDKTNLDIFWLKDDSLADMDNLPDPDILALEIVENIEAGLLSFREIVNNLNGK